MKRLFLSSVVVLSALLGLSAQPKVIAHRGYWRAEGAAQNSVASLRAAGELGCWGSEFDVWLTADDQLVLYHDNEFEGRRVEELSLAEMQHHRLENGEPLPLLEDFLRVAHEYPDLHLVFELKPHNDKSQERKAVRAAVAMVEALGLAERTDYISFSKEACLEFIAAAPGAKVYYLQGELSARKLKQLGFAGADYNYNIFRFTPKMIKRLHALGLESNAWTVNDPKIMTWLADHHLDYLTTDYPEVAMEEFFSE